MLLSKLLKGVTVLSKQNFKDIEIENLTDNSKNLGKNQLFFAITGYTADGKRFIKQAIKNGAVAVISNQPTEDSFLNIVVTDVRVALSIISNNFFNSANKLKIVGVTGTNGKTSTTLIIKSILESAGKKVGAITTNEVLILNKKYPATLTTPDPIKLHSLFAEMVKQKCEYVVMEVSAHSIFLNKIYGINFEVGVFTNLSQDHLDFFKNMQNYANTKKSFFTQNYCKCAVVNADDETGRQIINEIKIPTISYGIKNPADCFAINLSMNLKGSNFVMNFCDDILKIKTKLCGLFNVYNLLCASCVCKILGLNNESIVKGIFEINCINGRFNKVELGQKYNLIIDYAHTPESLRNLLATVKSLTKKKTVLVFGCPGNRDREKRSIMGEIAGEFCDYVVVTSDNPSYENSLIIMKEIENGLKKTNCKYKLIDKRSEAIMFALSLTSPKNNLVIAGKGVEDYQDINGMKLPYNDFQTIKSLFNNNDKSNQKFVY